MMESAGRNLALHTVDILGSPEANMSSVAGGGGNGGSGLCCARHLHNHGHSVHIILNRASGELEGAAKNQLNILQQSGLHSVPSDKAALLVCQAEIVVEALIG